MRNISIVCYREIRSYLTSPTAYIVTAVFLGLGGFAFVSYLAMTGYSDASIRGFLDASQILIFLFSALLTMRLIAEEKKSGTWELLLSVPIRDSEIVLGKFLGSLALLATMLMLSFYFPILAIVFGNPDLGSIFASYVGLLLLGCACLAIGIFASSLTSNQIVSAVISAAVMFGLWSLDLFAGIVGGKSAEVLSVLSLSRHFNDLIMGIMDTRAIVYYASVTATFLYLATRSIETDRWR